MALCDACGMQLTYTETPDGAALCRHHDAPIHGDRWACSNARLCDWLHRGILSTSTSEDDDGWVPTLEAMSA